jgi:hypothetical protein
MHWLRWWLGLLALPLSLSAWQEQQCIELTGQVESRANSSSGPPSLAALAAGDLVRVEFLLNLPDARTATDALSASTTYTFLRASLKSSISSRAGEQEWKILDPPWSPDPRVGVTLFSPRSINSGYAPRGGGIWLYGSVYPTQVGVPPSVSIDRYLTETVSIFAELNTKSAALPSLSLPLVIPPMSYFDGTNTLRLGRLASGTAATVVTAKIVQVGSCRAALQPRITSIASAQFPNARCNKLNRDLTSPHVNQLNWGKNNPILLGAGADGLAHLEVELDGASPSANTADTLIGIMEPLTGSIVASAAASRTAAKTIVTFDPVAPIPRPSSGFTFQVVLGRKHKDSDKFDPQSIFDTFPGLMRIVNAQDTQQAKVGLEAIRLSIALGSHIGDTFATALLDQFLHPDSSISYFAKTGTTSLRSDDWRLTHPTGQNWAAESCLAEVDVLSAGPSSQFHTAFISSEQFAYVIRDTLQQNLNGLKSALRSGSPVAGPFSFSTKIAPEGGPNQWGGFFAGVFRLGSQDDFYYSLNQLEIRGQLQVALDPSTREVTNLKVNGTVVEDLIDFDIYAGPLSQLAALVQSGYPTISSGGKTFIVRVDIDVESSSFDFFPDNYFESRFVVPND